TIRNATRKSATKASATICAGLAPKRAAREPEGAASVVSDMAPAGGARASLRRQGLFGERLGLRVVLARERVPRGFELGLAPGRGLARLELLECRGDRLVARLLLADRDRGCELA